MSTAHRSSSPARNTIAGLLVALVGAPDLCSAQDRSDSNQDKTRTIEEKTAGMDKIDGFFPLYWESKTGHLWMEIRQFDREVLHLDGLAAGLGSNDIGLDRGQSRGSRIVTFQRVGPKVLMVQPNYGYRAASSDAAERRAVRDAFARSVLWGFLIAAETGPRVLVDLNGFLLRDSSGIASSLQPGSYRLDSNRSTIYMPMTAGFPKNTETPKPQNPEEKVNGGEYDIREILFELFKISEIKQSPS